MTDRSYVLGILQSVYEALECEGWRIYEVSLPSTQYDALVYAAYAAPAVRVPSAERCTPRVYGFEVALGGRGTVRVERSATNTMTWKAEPL